MVEKTALMFLKGKRIYLRRLTSEDISYYLKATSNPTVRKLTGTTNFFTESMLKEAFNNWSTNDSRIDLLICLEKDDEVIGDLAIVDIEHRERKGSFRIAITDERYTSNGYGREALHLIIGYMFDTLNLRKININVYAFNERAIHVYKKLGFKEEGRIREDLYFDGEYHDNLLMGLFRNEYLAE